MNHIQRSLTCLFSIWIAWPTAAIADDIRYLPLPQQSLSAFLTAIESAKSTIDISTFIYEPCDSAVRVLTNALAAKVKAGVQVRVMLDGLQQSFEQQQNIAAEFAIEGIDVGFYSNTLIDINTRLHAKFMVIDGQQFIAGGRNFSDEYWALSTDLNYVDRDILVSGPSAALAQAAFNEIWDSDMVGGPDGWQSPFVDWNTFCKSDLAPAITAVQNYLQQNAQSILQSVPVRSCNIQFAVDNSDFFKADYGPSWDNGNGAKGFLTRARLNRKNATQAVLNFLKGTKQSLVLENYSYMPTTVLESAFANLRARKIPVQILTNQDIEEVGLEVLVEAEEYELAKASTNDSVGSEWDGQVSSEGAMTSAFALTPTDTPFFIHGKVGVRDGHDILVGSFNMDSRSANINVETAATITNCPDLASDVTTGYTQIYNQYEQDVQSKNPAPKPNISELARILGDLLLPEF